MPFQSLARSGPTSVKLYSPPKSRHLPDSIANIFVLNLADNYPASAHTHSMIRLYSKTAHTGVVPSPNCLRAGGNLVCEVWQVWRGMDQVWKRYDALP